MAELRTCYLEFAENEAKGASPLYEELARTAALLGFIASALGDTRQPIAQSAEWCDNRGPRR